MTTQTKHIQDCKRVFKNYDLNCSRRKELASRAEARRGWNDVTLNVKKTSHCRGNMTRQGKEYIAAIVLAVIASMAIIYVDFGALFIGLINWIDK